MLKSIYIDNYALIEQLEIELQEGLSILTGETGAGKSILLGALGLLLGRRADTNVLKEADRKCIVEGVFKLTRYGLEHFFEENALDYQNETIIRREIGANGKSRAFINDTPVNLDVLQVLALSLIDIHSQYQNLSLNSEAYLRWIIDCFAGLTSQVQDYSKLYNHFVDLKNKYYKAREAYQTDKDNFDFLHHQFNELQTANLVTGELTLLEEEFTVLSHAEEIKSELGSCIQLLSDDEQGVIRGLKQINDLLTKIRLHYPKIVDLDERLKSSFIEIKDIATALTTHFEKVEYDPERLEKINLRMDLLHTLLLKYKVKTTEELILIRNQVDDKLKQFSEGDLKLEKLAKESANAEAKTQQAAQELSADRKNVISRFEEKVQYLIRSLGMKNARFTVHHETTDLSVTGIDKIQFLFSANSNVPVQPVARVASGGELSRLMLSIKYLISTTSGLPTIIFDEIDTGVSGEIADKVGRLIKEMAVNMQVINITHLPQVASKGDHHYLVYKESERGTTVTKIKKLNHSERLNEIARMLSGDSVTDAAIENAKVLLGN
jgi:DNA repair protein RecN (Recombination protein N)